MMKTKKQGIKYPSARLKGLEEFMAFVQEPDWRPSPINIDLFKRLGMAKGKEGLAVHALKFIRVINEYGTPTEEFDNLKNDNRKHIEKACSNKLCCIFQTNSPETCKSGSPSKIFLLPC